MTNTYIIYYKQPTDGNNDLMNIKSVTFAAGTMQSAIRQFELKFHDSVIISAEQQENE
jgi:hypothetical protein